jgi:hypothetical protein
MQQVVENGIEDVIFYGPVFSCDRKRYLTYGGSRGNELVVKVVNNESIVCRLETHSKIVSASFLTKNTDVALVVKDDDSTAPALVLINTETMAAGPLIFLPGISHVLGYTCMSVFLAIEEQTQLVSSDFAWEVKYNDCNENRYTYTKSPISDDQLLSQKGFYWATKYRIMSVKDSTMQVCLPKDVMGVTFKNDGAVGLVPFLHPIQCQHNNNNNNNKKK